MVQRYSIYRSLTEEDTDKNIELFKNVFYLKM